ncbi:MAG: hypothetical protein HC881_10810 [Leptolyngbyaceae cyanobacterium SL_7_1]|nr:hypothetical protein [Leptolyngbyaceae cyanobacterium SL_7_1]
MAINPTLALTLILLSLMVGAGVLSGSWGYSLGREALKSVTQPDTRPGNPLVDSEAMPARHEGFTLLKEEEILNNVKARVEGKSEATQIANPIEASPQTKALADPVAVSPEAQPALQLPVGVTDQAVSFQVLAVRQVNDSLVMDVSLHNQGAATVEFLYSFMDIVDDQARTFTGSAEGLPSQVPPTAEPFYGTVTVPLALVDGAKHLSIRLSDYPNQQLTLQVSDIPVGG